jgi:hypothetical protein
MWGEGGGGNVRICSTQATRYPQPSASRARTASLTASHVNASGFGDIPSLFNDADSGSEYDIVVHNYKGFYLLGYKAAQPLKSTDVSEEQVALIFRVEE